MGHFNNLEKANEKKKHDANLSPCEKKKATKLIKRVTEMAILKAKIKTSHY